MKEIESDHPMRKKVILTVVKRLGVIADSYEGIPDFYKEFYSQADYITLVRPLLTLDRNENKLTYGQLAIKYGLTERQVEYHFCCSRKFILKSKEVEDGTDKQT